MNKKIRIGSFILCLLFCLLTALPPAYGISVTSRVQITKDAQVVDSILYNNILTQAIYTPKANVANYNTDATYCCAALVKRFYSNVFKITVYGLVSTSSTPTATAGSFFEVSTPKAGDIVRFNTYTHWAIIKKIDSAGNITLLEQNVWSGDNALVGRVISKDERNSGSYTYFRYTTSGTATSSHTHDYKKKYSDTHPHQYYMACSCGDYYYLNSYNHLVSCQACYNDQYGKLAKSAVGIPTPAAVKINGKEIDFDAYNINGNNFFKLRDLAYSVNGTAKKFAVDWDNSLKAVNMTTGSSYKANGSEMSAPGAASQKADITNSLLYLNKTRIYPLTYIIKNNNYVKLQDWAKALDIKISYDAAKKLITIDTTQAYS